MRAFAGMTSDEGRIVLRYFRRPDGALVATAKFGPLSEGAPGLVHGGAILTALDEALGAAGQIDGAIATWQQVLSMYAYSRARVQYADLLIQKKDYAEARKSLEEVINDAPYVTKFQRKREKVWFDRAKSSLRSIPA